MLQTVAITVLEYCPHVATCERVWSEMGNAHTSMRHNLKSDTVIKMMRVKHHYGNENKKKLNSGSVASVTKKYSKLLSEDDTMTSTSIFGPDAPIEAPLENIVTLNEESGEDEFDDDYEDDSSSASDHDDDHLQNDEEEGEDDDGDDAEEGQPDQKTLNYDTILTYILSEEEKALEYNEDEDIEGKKMP